MESDELVCVCAGVTREQVENLIDNGLTTVYELSAYARVCTGCGECLRKIQEIINDRLGRNI